MSSTRELILRSQDLAHEGSNGFEDDEGFDGWIARFDAFLAESTDKLLACRFVSEELAAKQVRAKEIASQFTDLARKIGAAVDRVDDKAMALAIATADATGKTKFDTEDGRSVTLVTTRQIDVQVTDLEILPTRFARVKVEADKSAIKAAHKLGESVPGVTCVDTESKSLRWSK